MAKQRHRHHRRRQRPPLPQTTNRRIHNIISLLLLQLLVLSFPSLQLLIPCEALKLTSLGASLIGLDDGIVVVGADEEDDTDVVRDDPDSIGSSFNTKTSSEQHGHDNIQKDGCNHDNDRKDDDRAAINDNDDNRSTKDDDGSSSSESTSDFNSRQAVHEKYLESCRFSMGSREHLCDESDAKRIERNLKQPAMMKNFTKVGYQKIPTPTSLQNQLHNFWWSNSHQTRPYDIWDVGSTSSFNFWEAATRTMSIDNPTFQREAHIRSNENSEGGGGSSNWFHSNNFKYNSNQHNTYHNLRNQIWEQLQPIVEDWAGIPVTPSALYGVRVFGNKAVVPPHVDDLPFVISVVIHVASSIQRPWELEMIGHDGVVCNVTMEPGEMLVYEGQSVIHGRPYPLKGMFYSDVFVHFEPLGYSLQHEEDMSYSNTNQMAEETNLEQLYQRTLSRSKKAERHPNRKKLEEDAIKSTKIPIYLESNGIERWIQTHPQAKLKTHQMSTSISAHTAAAIGDLDVLMTLADENPNLLKKEDANGWTPLHEAVRSGSVQTIDFLLAHGLDINRRTNGGKGGSPLWWAKKTHGTSHDVVKYLESKGAKDIPPDGLE